MPRPAQEQEPRQSSSLHKSSSSKKYSPSVTSSSRKTSFCEYTDKNRDYCLIYRAASPAVLENIVIHSATYSSQYMPEKFNPALSARSGKVIRDAVGLAVITPGLKITLEIQYRFYVSMCTLSLCTLCKCVCLIFKSMDMFIC